jgi:hypothetical protein
LKDQGQEEFQKKKDEEIQNLRKEIVMVQQEIEKRKRSNSFKLGEVGLNQAVNLDFNPAMTPMQDEQLPADTQIEPNANLETLLTIQTEN